MDRAFSLYAGGYPFCGILSRVFSLKENPWLRLFRVPILLTVPGDALVGAAFVMPVGGAMLPQAFAACVGVLFLYMYGLVDNDLANAASDAETAPDRPIPRGEITPRAAMVAMFGCLVAASLLPNWIVWHFRPGERLPLSWNVVMVLLVCCIYAYNRKKLFLFQYQCKHYRKHHNRCKCYCRMYPENNIIVHKTKGICFFSVKLLCSVMRHISYDKCQKKRSRCGHAYTHRPFYIPALKR